MVRSFDGRPIDMDRLDGLCAEALRAPTAGNAAGVSMVTAGRDTVPGFFAAATDPAWRTSAQRAPGLQRAGAVVLVLAHPERYFDRYAEGDKAASGLSNPAEWPVPYWHTDAAMAAMALLLLINEAGWAATLWGSFRHSDAILQWAQAGSGELFASVLVGHGDGLDRRSASLDRPHPTRRDRVRRLGD